jgi:hypothetical protein
MKAHIRTVREIEHHDVVSAGILAYTFCDDHPHQWTTAALFTLEEAAEAYTVKVLAKSHFTSSDQFLVGFQHGCYYSKARRSCTAGTVQQAPAVKYGQNGQRLVLAHCNRGNAVSDQETSHRCTRRDDAESGISGA